MPNRKSAISAAEAYCEFSPLPPVRAKDVRIALNDGGAVFNAERTHLAAPSKPSRRWRTRSVMKSISMTVAIISKSIALTSVK